MKCKLLKFAPVLALSTILLGCSAAQTAMKKSELSIDSQTSFSVVLEPVAPSKRIVYAKVRDLSGNSMRKDMQRKLESLFISEGFVVTDDPDKANMMITASIIAAEKTTAADANRYLNSGYKGGAEGAVAGAGISAIAGGSGSSVATAAAAGAAVGFIADTLVEDVYYTFVMDVQLRERPLDGDVISNSTKNNSSKRVSSKNTSTSSNSNSSVTRGDNFKWIVYETRIVTTANKMNLEITEAIPVVQGRTAETLTEMMM
ncbi:complement resistance protein TraT [Motilimonas sp. 1_MG-2023]|nr:complement resistance protein TraT [Motilimonas sp. 1_MG-2023]MDO6527604.1 complement resistance protein TraT [Motilimonas sp. 1_MG-2023]